VAPWSRSSATRRSGWGERTRTCPAEVAATNSATLVSASSRPQPMTMRWSAVSAISLIRWRTRTLSESAEARAQKAVAVSFFLLAPYIAVDAARTLIAREHASTSWLGVGLSVASLLVMPLLGVAKRRLGARLGSAATAGEGTQNLICAYLAAAVLVGLLANTLLGLWWLDPLFALGIAGLAVREGIEAWKGEECC
jgi:Cation efflux family